MGSVRPPRSELETLAAYEAKLARADVDLSANESPENLPSELIDRIARRLGEVRFNRYPDPLAEELRELIAQANGLEPGNVLIGNGGDELVLDLMLAWAGAGRKLLNLPPTFAMYEIDAHATSTEVVTIPRRDDFSVDPDRVFERLGEGDIDLVAVSNPNNPTGNLEPETFLIELLGATDAMILVDEAYFEFSRHTMRPHMGMHENLVILRTFSKAFNLAGLRVGYLLGPEDVIRELTKVRQPYSVDAFSQFVAGTVFRERAVFEAGVRERLRGRDVLFEGLRRIPGVEVFPSEANFVLFRVKHASAVWRDLLHNDSVLVRDFTRSPGLADCLRVTVGSEEQNERFLDAMDRAMASKRASEILGVSAVAQRHEDTDE